MKNKLYISMLYIILIPIAGEFKFFPFHASFRVSLGTIIFFFLLLWTRKIPMIIPTFAVGASVLCFRIFLDFNTTINFQLASSFLTNLPAFLYYFTYSFLFYAINVKKFQNHLLIIVSLSTFIELSSNILELTFRHFLLGDLINYPIIVELVAIALIRSIFVLGIFSMLKLHEAELRVIHQQNQNAHMIFLISNLYEESIELKKSLQNAENITRNCYNLYRKIQDKNSNIDVEKISRKLLIIAGEVHDIKKDNQRIYSGISKMISNENSTDYMSIKEIGEIIVKSNRKYADALGKNIKFILSIKSSIAPIHVYTTLSLINNLVSNAVESILQQGLIEIVVYKIDEYIKFEVHDDGSGIPENKRDLIFKAGYTTKYDVNGNSSTGMGLPYVKKMVEDLNGSIELKNLPDTKNTIFVITLSIKSLSEKG